MSEGNPESATWRGLSVTWEPGSVTQARLNKLSRVVRQHPGHSPVRVGDGESFWELVPRVDIPNLYGSLLTLLMDMPEVEQRTTLYRMFGENDELLYIGIAGNPGRRFEQHRTDKPWWGDVLRVETEHFATREEAQIAEDAAIKEEDPRYNKAGVESMTKDDLRAALLRAMQERDAAIAEALNYRHRVCELREFVALLPVVSLDEYRRLRSS